MRSHAAVVLYIVLMAALIVAVDVLVFRGRFWPRLLANVAIVLIFAALYFKFVKRA